MKKQILVLVYALVCLKSTAQKNVLTENDVYRRSLQVKKEVKEEILPIEWQILPSVFSLRRYAPVPIVQEGNSCVGASTTYSARSIAWNYRRGITDKEKINATAFDPYFVYNNLVREKKKDCSSGALTIDGMDFLVKNGAIPLKYFGIPCEANDSALFETAKDFRASGYETIFRLEGFDPATCDSSYWNKNANDLNAKFSAMGFVSREEHFIGTIKKFLADGNPVVYTTSVVNSMMDLPVNAPVWFPDAQLDTSLLSYGHAMVITGWNDTKYGGSFEIMQSNGTRFGEKGFFYLPYRYAFLYAREAFALFDFGKENGIVESFYEDGQLKQRGEVCGNKKCGVWTNYYPDGRKSAEVEYREGWRHGNAFVFSEEGAVLCKATFNRGKLNHEFVVYDLNGKKVKSGNFSMGKGKVILHYGSFTCEGSEAFGLPDKNWIFKYKGKTIASGNFENGRKEGQWTFFTNKEISGIANYHNDRISGSVTSFDEGFITSTVTVHYGKLDGAAFIYNKKGEVEKKMVYENGILLSETDEFGRVVVSGR